MTPWPDATGVITLPGGSTVRGRSLRHAAGCPAEFTLMLAPAPVPPWTHRRLRWPDFWVPLDHRDALDALAEVLERSRRGERVEVGCAGGIGRTGTALAALAILDVPADSPARFPAGHGGDGAPRVDGTVERAVAWVRTVHHPRAVETPWQRWWLRRVAADVAAGGPPRA